MIVKNPTKNDITVTLSGNTYTVLAEGELRGVSEKNATEWKNKLHNFLILKPETVITKVDEVIPEVEEVVEVVEETLEEITPEVEVVEDKKDIKGNKKK